MSGFNNLCAKFQHLFSSAPPISAIRFRDSMNQADVLRSAKSQINPEALNPFLFNSALLLCALFSSSNPLPPLSSPLLFFSYSLWRGAEQLEACQPELHRVTTAEKIHQYAFKAPLAFGLQGTKPSVYKKANWGAVQGTHVAVLLPWGMSFKRVTQPAPGDEGAQDTGSSRCCSSKKHIAHYVAV
eukprot:1133441-Pelagomonas_calceolata.AAC.2